MDPRIERPVLQSPVGSAAALVGSRRAVVRLIEQPARRVFLQRTLASSGQSLLTGCDVSDGPGVQPALGTTARFNDEAQAFAFTPNALAPVCPESMNTQPFPFKAHHGGDKARVIDEADDGFEVRGFVARPARLEARRHACAAALQAAMAADE